MSLAKRSLTNTPTYEESFTGVANRYSDKVTVITGGAMGIGEGCSRIFFEAGSNIVIFDKNPTVGEQLIQELNQRGPFISGASPQASFIQCDVTDED